MTIFLAPEQIFLIWRNSPTPPYSYNTNILLAAREIFLHNLLKISKLILKFCTWTFKLLTGTVSIESIVNAELEKYYNNSSDSLKSFSFGKETNTTQQVLDIPGTTTGMLSGNCINIEYPDKFLKAAYEMHDLKLPPSVSE